MSSTALCFGLLLFGLLGSNGCGGSTFGGSSANTQHPCRSSATELRGESKVAGATDVTPLHREIRGLNAAMEAAFRAGKMNEVAAFYANDAMMMAPGGGRVIGRDAIDSYWARFQNPVDWTLDVISVEGDATLAVERGQSTLVYYKDGTEHRSIVQFILVWVKVDGEWKIAVDTYWS